MKKYILVLIFTSFWSCSWANFMIRKGLGASGDFVFITDPTGSDCTVSPSSLLHDALTGQTECNPGPCNSPSATGMLVLRPGHTYHITSTSMFNFYSNVCGCSMTLPLNLSPTIGEINCNGTLVSSNASWSNTTCDNNNATCSTTSVPIAITLPN